MPTRLIAASTRRPSAVRRAGRGCGSSAPSRGTTYGDDALAEARTLLADGAVVAVKGIGGYHLACDATDETAVAMLRKRKQRGDKPFAVMVASLDDARFLASLTATETDLVASRRRPVLLASRRPGTVADAVRPRPGRPGRDAAPTRPLHYLLLEPARARRVRW